MEVAEQQSADEAGDEAAAAQRWWDLDYRGPLCVSSQMKL
jgi:hypothetical protein